MDFEIEIALQCDVSDWISGDLKMLYELLYEFIVFMTISMDNWMFPGNFIISVSVD